MSQALRSATSLQPPWLLPVRVTWLVCVLVVLAVVVGFVPVRMEQFAQLCNQDAPYFQFSGAVAWCTGYRFGIALLPLLASLVITGLAVSQRSDDWLVLLSTLMVISTASLFAFMSALVPVPPEWYTPTMFVRVLSPVCLFVFLFVFPDGRVVPRVAWVPVVASVALAFSWLLVPGSPFNVYNLATWPLSVMLVWLVLIAGMGAQMYRFRRVSTAVQKQQTKWILFAMVAVVPAFLIAYLPFGVLPALREPGLPRLMHTLVAEPFFQVAYAVGMIFTVVAILRYRLWDIDIIIRRTLTYASVGIVLAVVYMSAVVILQQLFASMSNQRSEIITVLSTLAIAALFVPLRNRIQAAVDRRFNRRHYDAQQVLADFSKTVRDETDLEMLTARLMQVVDETMQPKSISVWLRRSYDRRSKSLK